MNYLAHAYLSFNSPGVLLGNMISDYVKGQKQFDYPEELRAGIVLHRRIDQFTDTHDLTRVAKQYFREAYGLYSAAIVDVLFDHFLATDEQYFDLPALASFSQSTYRLLEEKQNWFPEKFSRMFPYMKSQDWLYHYHSREGLARSLEGLSRRAQYIRESETAFRLFEEHYDALREIFHAFFPELLSYSEEQFQELISRGAQNV